MDRTRRIALAGIAAGALAVTGTLIASSASADGAIHAHATIASADGSTIGWAKFTEDGRGVVHVNVSVFGLAPGLHGTHVHAVGACDAPLFTTAGAHFNPGGAAHGRHEHGDHADHHAGDLPNLSVTPSAHGHLTTSTAHFTLSHRDATSLFDSDGSAIVVHAGPDDYVTQPTGNSGGRVACGVIERT